SACESVLTEMNSTPSRCSSIMRLTALPPPPPTPTTFIRAFCVALSSNSKIISEGTPGSALRESVGWNRPRHRGRDCCKRCQPRCPKLRQYNADNSVDYSPKCRCRNENGTDNLSTFGAA